MVIVGALRAYPWLRAFDIDGPVSRCAPGPRSVTEFSTCFGESGISLSGARESEPLQSTGDHCFDANPISGEDPKNRLEARVVIAPMNVGRRQLPFASAAN